MLPHIPIKNVHKSIKVQTFGTCLFVFELSTTTLIVENWFFLKTPCSLI